MTPELLSVIISGAVALMGLIGWLWRLGQKIEAASTKEDCARCRREVDAMSTSAIAEAYKDIRKSEASINDHAKQLAVLETRLVNLIETIERMESKIDRLLGDQLTPSRGSRIPR